MAVMDEFKEEREKIKTASPKQKWKYFKDYYLMGVLIAVGVLAIVIAVAHSILTHKEDALYVCMVNFAEDEAAQTAITEAFTQRSGIDTKREQIGVESSCYISPYLEEDLTEAGAEEDETALKENETFSQTASVSDDAQEENGGSADAENYSMADAIKYRYEDEQKLAALVITGSVDLIITGEDVFHRFIKQEYFAPLDAVYSGEQLRAFEEEGRLLSEDGVPLGIYMDGAPLLEQNYYYNGEGKPRIVAGFLYGSKHPELAMDFLEFLEGR